MGTFNDAHSLKESGETLFSYECLLFVDWEGGGMFLVRVSTLVYNTPIGELGVYGCTKEFGVSWFERKKNVREYSSNALGFSICFYSVVGLCPGFVVDIVIHCKRSRR